MSFLRGKKRLQFINNLLLLPSFSICVEASSPTGLSERRSVLSWRRSGSVARKGRSTRGGLKLEGAWEQHSVCYAWDRTQQLGVPERHRPRDRYPRVNVGFTGRRHHYTGMQQWGHPQQGSGACFTGITGEMDMGHPLYHPRPLSSQFHWYSGHKDFEKCEWRYEINLHYYINTNKNMKWNAV